VTMHRDAKCSPGEGWTPLTSPLRAFTGDANVNGRFKRCDTCTLVASAADFETDATGGMSRARESLRCVANVCVVVIRGVPVDMLRNTKLHSWLKLPNGRRPGETGTKSSEC
jgi:hypothetical protein